MANENKQNNSNVSTNQFTGGMKKDLDPSLLSPDSWTHARNAVNNSHNGSLGDIGNEPANLLCVNIPYTYIGSIYLLEEKWVIFSTDNINSEIGLFDQSICSYKTIASNKCLGFKTTNLITGSSKKNFDCTYSIYWDDGLNPTRSMNIDRPVYTIASTHVLGNCTTTTYSDQLDCEALRLTQLVGVPYIKLSKANQGGSLFNGSYQIAIAYTINQIRVTDYFTPSNIQSLFTHQNGGGALTVNIGDLDTNYDEYELVVISTISQKLNCVKFGNYSTFQSTVHIGFLDPTLPTIPFELIPLQTPSYEKSNALYEVSDRIIRAGLYTKFDFNYQPLANNIIAKWVALEVPADYYIKGGNITSYLRDENYVFFIRWIYNDGRKSASYVIPGRVGQKNELQTIGGSDAFELALYNTQPLTWEVQNTATKSNVTVYTVPEGTIIAEGDMGYAQSTETYPANKPEIWGSLCGTAIKFHKFPDCSLLPLSGNNGTTINILGVKFEGIQHPQDNEGNPITSIVGYEILRGSREGNQSIIAKGLLNNMAEYTIPNGITDRTGLYTNYPYNDLRTDPFLSETRVLGGCSNQNYKAMGTFRKDVFSFHSPETQFANPYLSPYELKIETETWGTVTGNYDKVFKHPEHKLIRDFALYTAAIVGVGQGLLALKGKKTTSYVEPQAFNAGISSVGTTAFSSAASASVVSSSLDPSGIAGVFTNNTLEIPSVGSINNGALGSKKTTSIQAGDMSNIPPVLAIGASTFLFTYFLGKGTQETIDIIKGLLPYQQFGYQYNSHGFYNEYNQVTANNTRRHIENAEYLEPYLQEFGSKYRINNLFRSRSVVLQLSNSIENPKVIDDTRKTIGDLSMWETPTNSFNTTTSAYYGSLKVSIPDQYGQLDGVIQLPITSGTIPTNPDRIKKYSSPVMFGGDQYVNRYTEKNTFFFFNDWMFAQPDGYPFDYNLAYNIPYTRYWVNTQPYDTSSIVSPLVEVAAGSLVGGTIASLIDPGSQIANLIGSLIGGATGAALALNDFKNAVLPNDYAHLDRNPSHCTSQISFGINQAYFYIFANGVRDFFVESSINVAQRDWEETSASRHYDYKSYTDLKSLFQSDIIKAGNNYKYDNSLSISKVLQQHISWGNILPRDYNPTIAETCFKYYPNRVIYSLPQELELKKDNWRSFLANNYKDFLHQVTVIKNVNRTGAIFYFPADSPLMFQGVDTLQTEGGIKITIGDGGLFQQPLQSTTNADGPYEYGSCQSKYSVIGTPHGIFSVSQNQGKIFNFAGGLNEISREGNKWWFAQYLPSKLLEDFPNFEHHDNPTIGVGVISGYDSTNEIVYFSKKDYQVKEQYLDKLIYISGVDFLYKGIPVKLGDHNYFNDASFTVSYDPKSKAFISFHDWIPEAILPTRTYTTTIKKGGIWQHNNRCDLFCNFYGIDYPFEVEFPVSTGQEITTLRSLEYLLEAYVYSNRCRDQFHMLDENFDRAIISNSEQCSGLLILNKRPKNNPFLINQYPLIGANGIDILYSKEENKYRLNQFWDVTKDRGEFDDKEYPLWNISSNGYVKTINPYAIAYTKTPTQRKKFRHYSNKIFLRRNKSSNVKLLLKLMNTKQLRSPR